jgi:predicted small integral membrane protein
MPSIETAVMVAIGALIMLVGWNVWEKQIKPGVETQAKKVETTIGK